MLSLLFVMRSGTMIYNGGFRYECNTLEEIPPPPSFKDPRQERQSDSFR